MNYRERISMRIPGEKSKNKYKFFLLKFYSHHSLTSKENLVTKDYFISTFK